MFSRSWRSFFKYWSPVIVMGGLIFLFSTDQFSSDRTGGILADWMSRLFAGISDDLIHAIHLTLRKSAHWTEYLIFSLLLLRAFRADTGATLKSRHANWTLIIVCLYALSDELHQTFVPSRTGSLYDVMIDIFGGMCGTLWMRLRHGLK